jgi:hypothetical protein
MNGHTLPTDTPKSKIKNCSLFFFFNGIDRLIFN